MTQYKWMTVVFNYSFAGVMIATALLFIAIYINSSA